MTSLAIGAAVVPPVPRWLLEHDGDRDAGASAGAKAMNHVVLRPLTPRLGRARLARDADARDLRACPGAAETTASIIALRRARSAARRRLPERVRLRPRHDLAVRREHRSTTYGRITTPPFATSRRRPSPSAAASRAAAPARTRAGPGRPAPRALRQEELAVLVEAARPRASSGVSSGGST